tara:strand:+ start:1736 stop:3124 length:1389 start_codon:yes stop_codon:yes gene_type:complete
MSDCTDYENHLAKVIGAKKGERFASGHPDIAKFSEGKLSLSLKASNIRDGRNGAHSDDNADPIIVRYSEGGDLVSRCDYNRALQALVQMPSESKTVVVYIHGWNNDSGSQANRFYNYGDFPDPDDVKGGDLFRFSELLQSYRDVEKAREIKTGRQPTKVIGIFVSWKGGSPIPYLDYWSRRSGADKLGRGGQVARLLSGLESISSQQEMASNSEGQSPIDNKLIYIGHSMGARVLYNSVAPKLISDAQHAFPRENEKTHRNIVSAADLILLINPALEASSYKSVDEYRYVEKPFHKDQLPLLLTIQSEGDVPTRTAFALAEGVGLINDPWQSAQRRRTIGHSERLFQTHYLKPVDACPPKEAQEVKLKASFCAANLLMSSCPTPRFAGETADLAKNCPDIKPLTSKASRKLKASPFLVIRAEQGALRGHSWMSEKDSNFGKWLIDYILKFNETSENRAPSGS